MPGARQQLALEQGEQGVREADQRAGRDGSGEGELAGVPVAVPPHGEEQGGQDEQHRLFGEDGRGGRDPRAEVVPEVTARGRGEGEGQQRPHHREVVEEDLPLEDHGQRGEPEEHHAEPGRPAGQRQAAAQHEDQDRADAADQQHRGTHGAHRHRLGGDQRGDPGEQGDLDPAEGRMVVPVGVVGQAVALLHRPGLGEVGALVVAEGRVVGDVPALHGEDRDQEDSAQDQVGPGGAEPARRLGCATGRTGPRHRPPLRGDLRGGRRGKGGGHAGTSSRVTGTSSTSSRGYGVSARLAAVSSRWAPTWVVSSQSLRPRCSRHTARTAAPASRTW
ncbi:hypothetical protein SPURM210S_02357 [Streptomyces purpurascens]